MPRKLKALISDLKGAGFYEIKGGVKARIKNLGIQNFMES